MQAASAQLASFIRSQIKRPAAYVQVQLATPDGSRVATQMVLPNVTNLTVTRTTDRQSDTASFGLVDDSLDYAPWSSKQSKYGAAFAPGVIDNKFLLYLGFEGPVFEGTGSYSPNAMSTLLRFTGYLETDNTKIGPQYMATKNASLVDLTKEFRYSVYDTFPHPLYGDQNVAYFDPAYNLSAANLSGGYATKWICDGKMFTLSNASKIYGSTHMDPAVYVDTSGGLSPTSTPVSNAGWSVSGNIGSCTNYTFDYTQGLVTFTSAYLTSLGFASGLPAKSVVSVQGNPTYMAPEVIIRKILVEKGNWSPNFLSLDATNVLIPMYTAQDQTAWDCIKEVCDLTCPRFIPWVVYVDANGSIHFQESLVDGPVQKTFLAERDFLTLDLSYTSQQISTVVRAEGSCYTATGDQTVTSIAYSLPAVNRYGNTQALLLDKHLTYNVRHLTTTAAVAYLNMLTASTLASVERPTLTLQADIWPDPTLEINDKINVVSNTTGLKKQFLISGITDTLNPGAYGQQITATDYYEPANYMLGLPSGVTYDTTLQGSTTAPSSVPLVGALRLGSGVGSYAYINGAMNYDPNTLEQIVPIWDYTAAAATRFDLFLSGTGAGSATTTGTGTSPTATNPWSYQTLPPGYSWAPTVNNVGQTVYYGVDPGDSKTVYVGLDNVFYKFAHAAPITSADLTSYWTPPGNTAAANPGTSNGTNGYTAYVWSWWYLCLDGSVAPGKVWRPIMRNNMAQDGVAITVPAGGYWLNNVWNQAPGPTTDGKTFYYGNVVAGLSNYAATPAGFVGAAPIAGDSTQLGVAFGGSTTVAQNYMNYQKVTRGHYCVYVVTSNGATQFVRVPFDLHL